MSDENRDLAELVARQAITDVLFRYSRGLDRMDRKIADTVRHPGGTADYGPSFRGSGAEFLDFVWAYHAGLEAAISTGSPVGAGSGGSSTGPTSATSTPSSPTRPGNRRHPGAGGTTRTRPTSCSIEAPVHSANYLSGIAGKPGLAYGMGDSTCW
jgi:hypothetical protein